MSNNLYILEKEPCLKCFEGLQQNYGTVKIADIRSEVKFTDSSLVYKLNTTYTMKKVALTISEMRGTKRIGTFNIYINNRQDTDLAEMKKNRSLWKRIRSQNVEPGRTEIVVKFDVPVTATNLLFEIQTVKSKHYYSNLSETQSAQSQGALKPINSDTFYEHLPPEIRPKFGGGHISFSASDREVLYCP